MFMTRMGIFLAAALLGGPAPAQELMDFDGTSREPGPALAAIIGQIRADTGPSSSLPQESERVKAWAVATIKEELGFRMAELKGLQARLRALEDSTGARTPAPSQERRSLQRRLMETYWAANRLKRELMLIAPEELSPDRPQPEAVVAPELRPLLGEPQAEPPGTVETAAALRGIADARSSASQKGQALDALRAHGQFSEETAAALLDFLERERDPALRVQAADVFYIIFYDVREAREAVRSFLLRAETASRLGRLMRDRQGEVRRSMAQFGQVLLFAFDGPQAESLARVYVPLLLDGLEDPDSGLRQEFVVALENAKKTSFFKAPQVREALRRRLEREMDPDIREALQGLLADD